MPDPSGHMTPEEFARDVAAGRATTASQSIVIDGVEYTPVPGMPGVYEAPWGERGRLGTAADTQGYEQQPDGTFKLGTKPGKQQFTPISDRYFNGPGKGGRMASDDPRYWQLQYDQLAAQYMNMGLDAESARKQALATLIANRNNTAVNTGQLSEQIAKQKAEYMASPRDAFAELYYGNQVGGATPFGDTHNAANADYQRALKEKGDAMFTNVNADLEKLRQYRDAIPPTDFLNPSPAVQEITGGTGGGLPASTAPTHDTNILQQMTDRLKAMSPEDQANFQKYVTAGQPPAPYGKGGQIDVGDMTRFGGYQPSSSEGGTNMNIHEPAHIVGLHSGHVYATVAENGYPEQIKITPTPSGKKKAMEMEKAGKAQKDVMGKAFGTGGTVTAGEHTPEELLGQLSQMLNRLGGAGGGTGASGSTLPDPRMLAGAPWEALQKNRRNLDLTYGGYSSMAGGGIDPITLADTVKQFTPNAPMNNIPRVNFL